MRALCVLVTLLVCSATHSPSADQHEPALERIDELTRAAQYVEAERLARDELTRIEANAGADPLAAARLINRLVESRLHQGKPDSEAEELAARAVRILADLQPQSVDHATALRNQAWLVELRGEARKAVDGYTRALDVLRGVLGADDPATLVMQKDVAMAYRNAGDFPRARTLLEDALDSLTRNHQHHPDLVVLRFNLGVVQWEQGEYAPARDSFQSAADAFARAHGEQHPRVSRALEGLAIVQVALGEYAQARATYLRSLAIREKGSSSPVRHGATATPERTTGF